jgi:hypothetical protein
VCFCLTLLCNVDVQVGSVGGRLVDSEGRQRQREDPPHRGTCKRQMTRVSDHVHGKNIERALGASDECAPQALIMHRILQSRRLIRAYKVVVFALSEELMAVSESAFCHKSTHYIYGAFGVCTLIRSTGARA